MAKFFTKDGKVDQITIDTSEGSTKVWTLDNEVFFTEEGKTHALEYMKLNPRLHPLNEGEITISDNS